MAVGLEEGSDNGESESESEQQEEYLANLEGALAKNEE
jgi:hypothetical protein